ncbi:WecB/TagA/CpsF family glycosyltransferase [Caballeronia zhejiangensis]|uniref:WecB/TagA/CpsF family glycosyltransferase n=1 Tax=Caballeronia zhejiangensis TaxID=871203 RepID=UPI001F523A54|nr:WecB/TagA/CpsF family glycosyltransferase [Caballeronia zhejiangensis]MCI1047009.1 WecB/TagA/CpsF family glycosyltransferase [Caballeronia zhejiangensis]
MKRVEMFDCPFDVASMNETVELIGERIASGTFTQHVVVNVAKLVHMRKDPRLAAAVRACDIINVDGMGVVWGARMLGHQVRERVAGIDLFDELLGLATRQGIPVFLLGSKPEVVEKTVIVVRERHPGIPLAGWHHGYFWDDEEATVELIRRSGAKMLFVAITSPKKEVFIERWNEKLGVSFVMGVGGTFDVVAGKVSRAPRWMQQSGLEWAYRVIQEPRRMWRRYLVTNSAFAWMLLKELVKSSAWRRSSGVGRRRNENGGGQ